MIVEITISRRLFVFSQSCVEVPARMFDVGGLAVGALDLVNCSMSVLGSSLSLTLVNKCRRVVIGLCTVMICGKKHRLRGLYKR